MLVTSIPCQLILIEARDNALRAIELLDCMGGKWKIE